MDFQGQKKCGRYNRVVASGGYAYEVVTFNEDTALTIDGRVNRAGLMVKLHNSLISPVFSLIRKTGKAKKLTRQMYGMYIPKPRNTKDMTDAANVGNVHTLQ